MEDMLLLKLFLIFILMIYLFPIEIYSMNSGVSIMPNSSDVYATVKEKKIINDIVYVTLHINEAKDYKSMPNFIKDQIGKDVIVVVSTDDLAYFNKDNVNVLLSVTGDERGQQYTAEIKP
jgi:hypothetical protein